MYKYPVPFLYLVGFFDERERREALEDGGSGVGWGNGRRNRNGLGCRGGRVLRIGGRAKVDDTGADRKGRGCGGSKRDDGAFG